MMLTIKALIVVADVLLTMDKDEVEMLLRYGAAILDKDDSSAEQFTEATIDKLLEKSTIGSGVKQMIILEIVI